MSEPRNRIRALNDAFRKDGLAGNGRDRVVLTSGVNALGGDAVLAIIEKVATFSDFTEDNDPHHEHDFGAIVHDGHRVFWKIDYFDRDCVYGSEDPADPDKTTRGMTVMLAEEY